MALFTFTDAIGFVQGSGYLLILMAMILEGPIITAAASFAASLGFFNIYIIFVLSLLGDLIGDIIHFGIGRTTRKAVIEKYGHKIGLSKKALKKIEKKLKNHSGKTLIIIKMTPILTTPGLMLAGALKVPLKKFVIFSLLITIPRTIFFVLSGFYFGLIFDKILNYFNLGRYIFVFLIIIVIASYLIFKKILKKVSSNIDKI